MEGSQYRNIIKQEQLDLSPPGDSGRQSTAIPPKGQLCQVHIHQLLPVIGRGLFLGFADLWALPAPQHTGRLVTAILESLPTEDVDSDRRLSD